MRIVLLLLASLITSMPAMAASARDIAQDMAATQEAAKTTGPERPTSVLSAAQQGNAEAQFEMGILYEYGFNMPDNEVSALAWYMVAASSNPKAVKRRDILLGKLSRKKIEAAEKLSKTLITAKTPVAPMPEKPAENAPMPETPMSPQPDGGTQIPEMTPIEPMPEPIQQPEKQ